MADSQKTNSDFSAIDNSDHFEVTERISRNQAKKASQFRGDEEGKLDVEYRQVRLEKVILVSSWSNAKLSEKEAIYSLDELERLSLTAGAEVLGRMMQQRPLPDKSTYLGKGKAFELKALCEELGADTVVVNETLQPSQRRAFEDLLQIKVIDRTALILDIFAQHASSKAGRCQVELAQLEYLLPRLRGWGATLSRQGGGQAAGGAGMGSRGPGETQLEVDRRRITQKISLLKKRLKKIKSERIQTRKRRLNSSTPSASIVGYTNAGKSSLLNSIAGSDILVQDALFATLETTTRKIEKPRFTITDTVGFIQDLPTTLVEAFQSTLEEALDCDILIHVVDISSPEPKKQISAVNEVLSSIRSLDGNGKIVLKEVEGEILVFNKIDAVDDETIDRYRRLYPNAIFVSAKTKDGIDELLGKILFEISKIDRFVEIDEIIPYDNGAKLAKIYQEGEILFRENLNNGIRVKALIPRAFS